MNKRAQLRMAIDIGGTFTDTVLMDARDQVVASTKKLTTHGELTAGAMQGAEDTMKEANRSFEDLTGFIHGTTLATNALIERRGAKVASVTTRGFRDILEIAYERRFNQYDINLSKPDLIVPRRSSFTIPERIGADGRVLSPLDESAVDGLLDGLDACGADALAICLLHSYANPAHEIRLRRLILDKRPDLTVSISSEVCPEAREFDRLCTTIANTYIQPLMAGYLSAFEAGFVAAGVVCPILMMTAGGGMTTIETAGKFPIRLVESGPAGGAILASRVAAERGLGEVLSFDMGGTTAKLCLIDDHKPQTSRQFEIARQERFVKGSGMPVRIPVVEMIEIGAGGGSIAGIDKLGRLTVGPKSAGSEPGPVAFAKGGKEPTVTDADVVMGLIDPNIFAEGQLTIDVAAAENAVACDLGEPLSMSPADAAEVVSQMVDQSMASAARMHAVENGKDLGARTMIAFGGNGPLHATRVARSAGVKRILIPRNPSVGSAVGFLFAPVSYEIARSQYAMLDAIEFESINEMFDSMVSEATAVVRVGAPSGDIGVRRFAYMRYHGQGHEVEIELSNRPLARSDIHEIRNAFEVEYSKQFSRPVPGMTIEILNWAVRAETVAEPCSVSRDRAPARVVAPTRSQTIVSDCTGEAVAAGFVFREELQPGDRLDGPVLIVEPQTTTLVSSDFAVRVDDAGNLLLTQSDNQAGQK